MIFRRLSVYSSLILLGVLFSSASGVIASYADSWHVFMVTLMLIASAIGCGFSFCFPLEFRFLSYVCVAVGWAFWLGGRYL